jgi:diguanylate cyclase (GGDEF)-like protein
LTAPRLANSFRLKLVAYLGLLSLVPMAAAFWGLTAVAGVSETQRVSSRQDSALRSALALYQVRLDHAEAVAERLARSHHVQRVLEKRDRSALVAALAGQRDVYVVGRGGLRAGSEPRLAARVPVEIVSGSRRLGTVVAAVPLDGSLVRSLRRASALDANDLFVLLQGSRIVTASPSLRGSVHLRVGTTTSVRVGDARYRALAAPPLVRARGLRLAVLTPQAVIDAADARTRDRLLFGLLGCLALVGIVALLLGRAIVRNLRAVGDAARAIAQGRLGERVPVRGSDEFAALGGAFNDMASQLEARLSELEDERARLRAATTRFGAALAATHDPAQLLRVIVDAASEATSARGCRLTTADGTTVETGDVDAGGERLELPLMANDASLGTLVLVGDSFREEQRLDAASLATQAAVALENARLHALVERQALVDALTGLANRRACEEALHTEVSRANRFETGLAVVLADLDGFKTVNDVYGHAAGDEALKALADILRRTARESDLAARWGGEEFVLLLPGTDEEGAVHLAERLRLALAGQELDDGDGRSFRVTASFGIAQYVPGSAPDDLFAAADRALYRAKRGGKNRVEREQLVQTL